jgi:hypothetical protein
MDSKMAATRGALESEAGDEAWTAFNPALDRRLLRLDDFLKTAEPAAAPQSGTLFETKPPSAPGKTGKE